MTVGVTRYLCGPYEVGHLDKRNVNDKRKTPFLRVRTTENILTFGESCEGRNEKREIVNDYKHIQHV